jgi:hypothetical protein
MNICRAERMFQINVGLIFRNNSCNFYCGKILCSLQCAMRIWEDDVSFDLQEMRELQVYWIIKPKLSCHTALRVSKAVPLSHVGAKRERTIAPTHSWPRHAPAVLYPPRKDPLYPLDRRLDGLQSWFGHRGSRKNPLLRRGSNPGRPVRSHTLYWLSYTRSQRTSPNTSFHWNPLSRFYFVVIEVCSTWYICDLLY